MAKRSPLTSRAKKARHAPAADSAVESAMREVHTDEPSTVTRAKHFGPGGKEAMLRAVAFNKARKRK